MPSDPRKTHPAWICHNCGTKHGRPRSEYATWHIGDACGWCERNDVPVTEPRDYGYPKETRNAE